MVTKARTNAEKRATDKNNQSYDITTVASRVNIVQNVPDTTVSLSQTSHNSSCTSRFGSWTLLCLGTGRRYPTTDNIFHSINYAKRPRSFNPEPRAKTNTECRICKLLESTGTHKRELYVNHYGNFPTHCPQWAKMNLAEKKRTSKLAEYCLRCFAPKVIIKSTLDYNRHHQTDCNVSSTNKHKFSCLNKSCLQHSWICSDHSDENRPLLDAHYKESENNNQLIPLPRSTSHILSQACATYPSALSPHPTQLKRAVSPLLVSSENQDRRQNLEQRREQRRE